MTNSRRLLLPALLLSLATTATAPAQAPKTTAIRLVARNAILDLTTGTSKRVQGLKGYVVRAINRNDEVFDVADLNIDLATNTRVRRDKDQLLLEDLAGKAKWSVTLKDIGVTANPTARLLTTDRVVIQSSAGLVAIDRPTGEVAWHSDKQPLETLTMHKDLLVTTGKAGGKFVMRAMSLRNGAQASLTPLLDKPAHIAIGDYGIAIGSKNHVEVFDRFGPTLFTIEHGVDDIVAHQKGWLIRKKAQVTLLDRRGETIWDVAMQEPRFLNRHHMVVTDSGGVIITTHHNMSDSGVHCRALDARSGEELWARQLPGLGVPHSKYFHNAYARSRGEVVDIISQGSAGAFVVTLETDTGQQRSRFDVK